MFQFSAFAYYTPILQIGRLPHSETTGSIPICGSPVLIAACRVLLRLWEPRHPPCALVYFLYRTALLLPYGCFRHPARAGMPLLPSLSLSLLVFFQYVKELFFRIQGCSKRDDDGLPPSVPNPPIFAPESVENNGFEPLTPCVQGRCSSQLS